MGGWGLLAKYRAREDPDTQVSLHPGALGRYPAPPLSSFRPRKRDLNFDTKKSITRAAHCCPSHYLLNPASPIVLAALPVSSPQLSR